MIDSLSAETLAELARENLDHILIDFLNDDETKDNVFIFARNIEDIRFWRKIREPLGEFFLRVAKERNYIK